MSSVIIRSEEHKDISVRNLLSFMFPLMFNLLSLGLMSFVDRWLLSLYSVDAMKGVTTAYYYVNLFQTPFVKIITMTHVFIGLYVGSKRSEHIGSCIWQMLWLSCLFVIAIIPLGFLSTTYFFSQSIIDQQGFIYFKWVISGTLFFLINPCLSAFFLAQGQNKFILKVNFLIQGIHLALDIIFIFGLSPLVPSLGILGSAIALVSSQALLTAILFSQFIKKKNIELFHTHRYQINGRQLWNYLKVSFQRGVGQLNIWAAWALIVKMLSNKHEDYLLVLALGSSIILILSCAFDALFQSIIAKFSHLIGSGQYLLFNKLLRSALWTSVAIMVITFFFLCIYPDFIIMFLFSDGLSATSEVIVKNSCIYFWIYVACLSLLTVASSIIVAFKDMNFYLICNFSTWITLLFAYVTFEILGWSAEKLWIIGIFEIFLFTTIYFLRILKKGFISWKTSSEPLLNVE